MQHMLKPQHRGEHAMRKTVGARTTQQWRSLEMKYVLKKKSPESHLLLALGTQESIPISLGENNYDSRLFSLSTHSISKLSRS